MPIECPSGRKPATLNVPVFIQPGRKQIWQENQRALLETTYSEASFRSTLKSLLLQGTLVSLHFLLLCQVSLGPMLATTVTRLREAESGTPGSVLHLFTVVCSSGLTVSTMGYCAWRQRCQRFDSSFGVWSETYMATGQQRQQLRSGEISEDSQRNIRFKIVTAWTGVTGTMRCPQVHSGLDSLEGGVKNNV